MTGGSRGRWGRPERIGARLGELVHAGASHVELVGVRPDDGGQAGAERSRPRDWALLEALAPARRR